MSDAVTKTVAPLRRKANPINGKHTNGVTIDGIFDDHNRQIGPINSQMEDIAQKTDDGGGGEWTSKASFMTWTMHDIIYVARHHWIPCLFAAGVMFFTVVEYTFQMTPASSQPFDLGFVATRYLHSILASSPNLNTVLAALNTVNTSFMTLSSNSSHYDIHMQQRETS